MRASVNHRWLMGVVSSVAAACLVGCETDTGRADKQLSADLAVATSSAQPGSAETVGLLERAAQQPGSPGYVAAAKSALAGAELARLQPTLLEHAAKQEQIRSRLYEIKNLAVQIATANTLIEGYQALNPEKAIDVLKDKIAEARGKDGAEAWISEDAANIPSLTALTQQDAKLTTDITRREDEIAKLQSDRQASLDEADDAFAKSEAADGQESVDQFNRGVAARKKAADLTVNIEQAEFELLPLRQDLALTKAQAAVLQGVVGDAGGQSVGSLQEQLKEVEARWATINTKIDEQKALIDGYVARINELAGANADATYKAGDEDRDSLAKLLAADAKIIETSTTTLNTIHTHYASAIKAAEELTKLLTPIYNAMPDKKVAPGLGIDATLKAFNTNGLKLQAAHAQATGAQLAMDQATTLQRRGDVIRLLSTAAEKSGVDLPAGLADVSGETLDAAKTTADAAFEAAKQSFVDVTEAALALPEHSKAAFAGLMFLNYQWSQYGTIIGDRELAREKLDDALTAKDVYVNEKGGVLGANLPPEIAGTYQPSTGGTGDESTPGTPAATSPATGNEGELMPDRPAETPSPSDETTAPEAAPETAPADEAAPESAPETAPADEAAPEAAPETAPEGGAPEPAPANEAAPEAEAPADAPAEPATPPAEGMEDNK